MTFERPDKHTENAEPTTSRPDRGHLVARCRQMLQIKGEDPDFAKHFVHEMCVPERPHERPYRTAVIGGGVRWDYGYGNRIVQSMNDYLAMSDDQRAILHAGIEDGVRWGGEPIEQYVRVVDETVRFREHPNPLTYIRSALRQVERLAEDKKHVAVRDPWPGHRQPLTNSSAGCTPETRPSTLSDDSRASMTDDYQAYLEEYQKNAYDQ